MTITAKHSSFSTNTILWAVICSILLHAALAVVIPNITFDHPQTPNTLTIELVKKPEPPPAVLPIQPQPAPPKPEKTQPKLEPKPIARPLPTTTIKNDSAPPTPPPMAAQTEIMAVAPKADTSPPPLPPVPIATPEPPQPAAPSRAEMKVALDSYGNTLWGAIGKYKQYPKIAQMRGWQGEVVVELLLDGNGKLKSKKILKGSGYEVLDRQALDMVEKAAPFPAPPEALRVSSFSITVPIPFKLE